MLSATLLVLFDMLPSGNTLPDHIAVTDRASLGFVEPSVLQSLLGNKFLQNDFFPIDFHCIGNLSSRNGSSSRFELKTLVGEVKFWLKISSVLAKMVSQNHDLSFPNIVLPLLLLHLATWAARWCSG